MVSNGFEWDGATESHEGDLYSVHKEFDSFVKIPPTTYIHLNKMVG